jgi:hypothetical protein
MRKKEQLSSPDQIAGAQRRASPIAGDANSGRMRQIRERERPEPSSVWLNGAFAFITCAVGTIIAALTLSAGAVVRPSELWIATGGLVMAGALCLVAHWDVNRGRRTREREIEDVPQGRDG